MYEFSYHKATSVDDAINALDAAEDGKLLAGGMTLLPTMKQRLAAPDTLVDLAGVQGLSGIEKHGDTIVIGAMTQHADVSRSELVRQFIPALADLAGMIGDPQVRNRGTLGGSVANADPAADYPAALVGLAATVNTDKRSITADDFFIDLFETALEENEIITSVAFPVASKASYQKFPNPASGYPVVGVFLAVFNEGVAGNGNDKVRVAVTGAAGSVFRQSEMEQALEKDFKPSCLEKIAIDDEDFNDDIHASAQYRAHLVTVMARRAVKDIL